MSFIALSRSVFDDERFAAEVFTEREAWIWLLCEAAWKPTKIWIGGQAIELERGECAYALRFLAVKFRWSKSRVYRFLIRMENAERLRFMSETVGTRISISNYDEYQTPRNAAVTRAKRERDKEEQVTKKKKPEKEGKGAPKVARFPHGTTIPVDWRVSQPLYEYGAKLGLTADHTTSMAEDMKLWARANANRSVARKLDWDAAFQGWMRREKTKRGVQQSDAARKRDKFTATIAAVGAALHGGGDQERPTRGFRLLPKGGIE